MAKENKYINEQTKDVTGLTNWNKIAVNKDINCRKLLNTQKGN